MLYYLLVETLDVMVWLTISEMSISCEISQIVVYNCLNCWQKSILFEVHAVCPYLLYLFAFLNLNCSMQCSTYVDFDFVG